jgi:hypothetical protein
MSSWASWLVAGLMLASLPASSSYQLNSYGFGSGGTADSSSATYHANGLAGEVSGKGSSAHYKVRAGENFEKEANVPTIQAFNDDNWYNKLRIVIGTENNPSNTLYAVAISADGFATTQYVKSDFTVGSTQTFSDYLSYAAWGGSSGIIVRGLTPNTIYSVKAKAFRGKFTDSPYGPVADTSLSATATPELSFDIDISSTDTSTSPPYVVSFGTIPVSTVTNAPVKVWVSLDTNAESGGMVYISGLNGGLKSADASYQINALTGNLATAAEGFGIKGASATQTSGGPLTIDAPYNGSGSNVGLEDTTIREVFNSSGVPIVGGRGSFLLSAKTKPLTPSSPDYTEQLTAIASASF